MSLRKALENEQFEERFAGANIVCQYSSLGVHHFLEKFLISLKAGGGYNAPPPEGGISLIWPTREEIRLSNYGYQMGGE